MLVRSMRENQSFNVPVIEDSFGGKLFSGGTYNFKRNKRISK